MRRSFVAALALSLVAACSSGGATSVTGKTSASPGPAGTATSTGGLTSPSAVSPAPAAFGYVPLWPFASVAAAEIWQRDTASGGQQPWRLDAGAVALAFTQQYLGFAEINRVTSTRITAGDAQVTVGYSVEGTTGTVAVIHLVRIGSGANRPWEVVGTKDAAAFTVTQPRYGSPVAGTIIVGGHIAGVDESIRVTARQLSGVVGSYCCLPAGAPAPWSARLTLTHPQPGPVTIVASTGGHVATVERFAITGVRSGS